MRNPIPRLSRRARAWLIAVVAVVVVTYIALSIPIYAPPTSTYDPTRVDAVFILGPPTPQRQQEAKRVSRAAGGVPMYLSVGPGISCAARFRCVHAHPWNTAGEAAALEQAVRDAGVRHPIVVTSTVHLMRSRYIFGRCVSVPVTVVGVNGDLPFLQIAVSPIYQWAALAKAAIVGCAPVPGG